MKKRIENKVYSCCFNDLNGMHSIRRSVETNS